MTEGPRRGLACDEIRPGYGKFSVGSVASQFEFPFPVEAGGFERTSASRPFAIMEPAQRHYKIPAPLGLRRRMVLALCCEFFYLPLLVAHLKLSRISKGSKLIGATESRLYSWLCQRSAEG